MSEFDVPDAATAEFIDELLEKLGKAPFGRVYYGNTSANPVNPALVREVLTANHFTVLCCDNIAVSVQKMSRDHFISIVVHTMNTCAKHEFDVPVESVAPVAAILRQKGFHVQENPSGRIIVSREPITYDAESDFPKGMLPSCEEPSPVRYAHIARDAAKLHHIKNIMLSHIDDVIQERSEMGRFEVTFDLDKAHLKAEELVQEHLRARGYKVESKDADSYIVSWK